MARKKRHSPEQIIAKLREAGALLPVGGSVGQVWQKLEVSEEGFTLHLLTQW